MQEIYETEMKNGFFRIDPCERVEMEEYCRRYMSFLDQNRIERTVIRNAVQILEERGFKPFQKGDPLCPGDRVYFVIHARTLVAVVIGKQPLEKGVRLVASHADSPRLDVRPVPLFQKNDIALLRTHYYGLVRKYQWFSIPLGMIGVVMLKNGQVVNVSIGMDMNDPVFVVPDLPPHLSASQDMETVQKAHSGEMLNLFFASEPLAGKPEEKAVRMQALKALYDRYGIAEDDLLSAELEIVPIMPVREAGIDRSLIAGYGQDDRVCGFAGLDALVDLKGAPEHTAVFFWVDKEEIGSRGITGARSRSLDYCILQLCRAQSTTVEDCYAHSICLSGDVTVAYDPNFPDFFEHDNTAKTNCGIAFMKYTGTAGKSGGSDAKAELVGKLRSLFDANGVLWQIGELGAIDVGGGGTVAHMMTARGIETLDAGTAVLGMHSPYEVVSKLDAYMTRKAYYVFYRN